MDEQEFKRYVNLVGLGDALLLLNNRRKAAKALEKSRGCSHSRHHTAMHGRRVNGPNAALGSLVASMGGKRKPKKTKRGY